MHNNSQNNVAKLVGFTACWKTLLLQPLIFTLFFQKQSLKYLMLTLSESMLLKPFMFGNLIFGNIVKAMFLATLFADMLQNQCFLQHCWIHVAKTIGVTTNPNTVLLNLLVVKHFQNYCCRTYWCYNMSKNNVAKNNRFCNIFKQLLLKHLTVDMFKINVVETNDFSNSLGGHVVEPIV